MFFKKLLSNNLVLEGKILSIFQDSHKSGFFDY